MLKFISRTLLLAASIVGISSQAHAAPIFASSVLDVTVGHTVSGGALAAERLNTAAALGGPAAVTPGTAGFYSLGFGGVLTLGFSSLFGSGTTTFYEVTNGTSYPREAAEIFVFDIAANSFVFAGTVDNRPFGSNDTLSLAGLCTLGCNALRLVEASLPGDFGAIRAADGYDLNAVSVTAFAPPVMAVPEPGSLALFGLGLVGLIAAARRKQA